MRWLAAILVLSVVPAGASALPIVSVDMDPATSAVESVRTVAPGATFSVAVVYSADGEPSLVNGFEFDLAYDPAQLVATAIHAGDFLLAPQAEVEAILGPPEVGVAFVTVGAAGAGGSGVLASIDFVAPLGGSASIELNDVVVAAPFGVGIPLGEIAGGTVVVPEPATSLLLGAGLLVLAARRTTNA